MTLLTRYLVRNNLFLLLSILLIGTGMYLLTDLFDRLDQFLDAGLGLGVILMYFAVKTPLIISQILPAVFLIAVIVQFSLMAKARESTALQAGGISPMAFVRFILIYALFWSIVQLAFSQALGVIGERTAGRIWKEQVRGKETKFTVLRGVWFTDGAYVVHLGTAIPEERNGTELLAYKLAQDGLSLEQIIRADSFVAQRKAWQLQNATVTTPTTYSSTTSETLVLPLRQDLEVFKVLEPGTNPSLLPVWDLGAAVRQLERSGSNVEVLRTAYHAKFAYAASLIAMGILALAIVLWRDNIYICIGFGLLVTFAFYSTTTVFNSLGEHGSLPPFVAGWASNVIFLLLGFTGIFLKIKPQWRPGGAAQQQ